VVTISKVAASVVVLAAAAIAIVYFATDRDSEAVLRASGTVESTNVDVSFEIAGRVTEVTATEGQAVKTGDLLARLAPGEHSDFVAQIQASLDAASSQVRQQELAVALREDLLESQVAQARGQAQALASAAEKQREGLRPEEIRVTEADLAQAEAILNLRRADFNRASELAKAGVVPAQQLDRAEAELRAAETNRDAAAQRLALAREGARREDIAEAEARLRSAQAGVGMAEAGRRDVELQREALKAARARERQLRAQLEAAKTHLGYTEIRSPLDGVVLTKNVESGEVVSPGTPVVTVANLDEVWMNIYVPETQTGLVKLNQAVDVALDSFPGETFKGKVTFVSSKSEFTPKTINTPEERVKLVYRVKLSIPNTQQRLKPGMPADAAIRLR
jgi:HlyD family secretion protein